MPPRPAESQSDETNPTTGAASADLMGETKPMNPSATTDSALADNHAAHETKPNSTGETKPKRSLWDLRSRSRTERRWYRFTVRRAMVLVLVIGGLIGWEANRVTTMRRAVAVLERPVVPGRPAEPPPTAAAPAGAALNEPINGPNVPSVTVFCDDHYRDGQLVYRWENGVMVGNPRWGWVPAGVRRFVGEDHFRQVARVVFARRPTAEDWQALAALGTVESLDLSFLDATDSLQDGDLAPLSNLTTLRELSLANNLIGDPALGGIDRLHRLRDLDLSNTRITDASLTRIGRLSNLRTLNLIETRTTDQGCAPLAALYQLQDLTLSEASSTDQGLAIVRGMPQLERLKANRSQPVVTHVGLGHLQELADLASLEINVREWDDAGVATLASLPRLKTLRINPESLGETIARDEPGAGADHHDRDDPAGESPRLTAAGVARLGTFPALRTLYLQRLPCDDDWLGAISRLPHLTELRVTGSKITDAGLTAVGNHTTLTSLVLSGRQVTNDGLIPLGRLRQLDHLTLDCPQVTDAGLVHLYPVTTLRTLVVAEGVTSDGETQLRDALPSLKSVARSHQPPH